MLKGIDISNHQGDPDFKKVKDDADFIIIKASEGVGFKDPKLVRNQAEIRKAGVPLGYYHFARPDLDNSAEGEADWFLETIGELQEGELLVLDFEVSYSDRVKWCKKFLDHVYKRTNVKPLIYLNKSLEKNNNWKSVIEGDYGLWLADYTYDPNSPIPDTQWPVVAMRQYSNNEKINGISGGVDGNVFYGDMDALLAYGFSFAISPIVTIAFAEFIKKWTGKPVDFDGYYGTQCMDLAHQYVYEVLGIKDKTVIAAPSAYMVYTNFRWPELFDRIPNDPQAVPKEGDLIVWDNKVGGGHGHIAIFVNGDVNSFNSFDANWNGVLPHLQEHNYNNVLGWLRYKGGVGDCESKLQEITRKLKDAKHKLESKAVEITNLENEIREQNKNFKILDTNYQNALADNNIKQKQILALDQEVKRLQGQKFELSEIIGFFITWLRTGGDSKDA